MRFLPLFVALPFLSACAEAAPDGWRGSVADSAGVTIVTNPVAPIWGPEADVWVEEELRIRPIDAVPETLFGFVADGALGEDGHLYLLDQQAGLVRVFDRSGAPVASVGGPGEGPGELGRLTTSVFAREGRVEVVDWVQHRLTSFPEVGSGVGEATTTELPHRAGSRSWWLTAADGELYFRTLTMAPGDDGQWTATDHLQRWSGGAPDTLFAFDYPTTQLGARGAPRLPPVVNAPAWTVLEDGTVAWTHLETAELRLRTPDGDERIVRSDAWMARPPTAADEEMLKALTGARLEMLGGTAEAVDQMPVDFPEALPVFTDLHAGPRGTLWVQRGGALRQTHPMAMNTPDPPRGWGGTGWDVLDAEGRFLGSVELPPRLRVLEIRGNEILGVQADANYVDEVVLMRIHGLGGDDS